jgi:4-hydroxybenzoyl-CoA thioesterase
MTAPSEVSRPPAPVLEVSIHRSDCDPAGIIYYPNYLDILEDAIEEWLGADYGTLVRERGCGLAIVGADCNFRAPVRMGDRLRLSLRLVSLDADGAVLSIDGEAGDVPRLEARLTAACMELAPRRRIPFPPELRARLAALEAVAGGSA